MLPTDLLPKVQQIIDRLAAIDYENPQICEQRIREAFSRHLIALNLRDRPVEIYHSFDAAFDAAWKTDRKAPWKAEWSAELRANKNAWWNFASQVEPSARLAEFKALRTRWGALRTKWATAWKAKTDAAWSDALHIVKEAALKAAWEAELKIEWEVVKKAALETVLKATPAAASDIVSDQGKYKLYPTASNAAGYAWWEFQRKITGNDRHGVFWSTWWCSPLNAAFCVASDAARQAALEAASKGVSGAAWDEAWKAAFKTAWDEADDYANSRVFQQYGNSLEFQNAERTLAWTDVVTAVSKAMRTVRWNTVWDAAFGTGDYWVPEREATQDVENYVNWAAAIINFTVSSNRHDEFWAVWMPFIDALEAGTFCFWMTRTKVIVLTAPVMRIQDDQFHADGQPAIQWSDGDDYYFWRGTQVPQKYGAVLSQNWRSQWLLEEPNAEYRRVLIQGIGYDRIVQELEAVELDTWREYSLLKIQADVDVEPIHLLKMTCPSTNRIHVLRTSPDITLAREAIAWCNWEIDPEQFSVES
jgi:hypothetical protein